MMQHGSRPGICLSSSTEIGGEPEGFHDREICLDGNYVYSDPCFLRQHLTVPLVEHSVYIVNDAFEALNLD
jgi:hypothetical protein